MIDGNLFVQPGDNLFGIAQAFGVPMSQIMEDNRLPNPSLLVVGQTLVIRFPEEVHTVQPGDYTCLCRASVRPQSPAALSEQSHSGVASPPFTPVRLWYSAIRGVPGRLLP